MLGDIFKAGWQSDSVEKRLRAIEKMDASDQANQGIFEKLATDDAENSVRQAALNKLTRPNTLYQISQTHKNSTTCAYAESALSALIGAKSTINEDEFKTLIANHPELALPIAKHCPYTDLRAELIESLPEAQQAELIAKVDYSETRQLIAENLESPNSLELARKLLKGKDKNSEKIIKSKLDALHAQQRQDQENTDTAEQLCQKMEFLANHSDWRPEFKGQYLLCNQRWEALNFTPNDPVQQRYNLASTSVSNEVERRTTIETTHKAQQQLALGLVSYCGDIALLSLEQLADEKKQLVKKISYGKEQWPRLSAVTPPEPAITDQYSHALESLQSVVAFSESLTGSTENETERTHTDWQATIALLRWSDHYPSLTAKKEATTIAAELKTQVQQAKQIERDKLDKLHKRINRLLGSTKRGNIGQARRELGAASKAAEYYSGKDKATLDERLEKASEAVDKMGDWKDFATEPKFLELCEAMEELIKSKAHPDKLSIQISDLQKKWKALGYADSADQHWLRFKTAGDTAYERCDVFFKKRHETRRENLTKREPVITSIRKLLENTEWDAQPDYKQVELTLRDIHNDWQKIKDVERSAGQKQWNKLSKYKSAIYQKLDVVYDKNIELKNQLIKQALALAETDVKEESIAKLQLFQTRWKQIGVTRRKQDQAAWKQFKIATDAVYDKIQGIRKDKRADEDAQLSSYRQISRQIQTLAKNANNLAEADSEFDRLQAEYKVLPPLPRGLPEKLIESLEKDFQRSSDTYSKARERIKQAAQSKVFDALSQKSQLCAALEQLSTNAPTEQIEQLQKELAEIIINDKALTQRFEARLSSALNTNRDQATQIRKRLCIDMEILLGVDSPEEDRALRMQIQLERMKQDGIGQNPAQKDTLVRELKLDWLCLPGAEPEIQKVLNQRVERLQL